MQNQYENIFTGLSAVQTFLFQSSQCANAIFPTHGDSWQQGKYFPILLIGWLILEKIGIVVSLKLMLKD